MGENLTRNNLLCTSQRSSKYVMKRIISVSFCRHLNECPARSIPHTLILIIVVIHSTLNRTKQNEIIHFFIVKRAHTIRLQANSLQIIITRGIAVCDISFVF